jgi:isoleucyl-tRNA synthetase
LYDTAGEPVLSADSLAHVIDVLDEKGVDHWWSGPVEDFIPPSHQGELLVKGTDTLDVWFDSGSSWTILEDAALRPMSQPLADVYLEGSDQHRGWFQSSLLTRLSTDAPTPYKTLITHGFVLDEEGKKMSKSVGNTISPMDVVNGGEVSVLCPKLISGLSSIWLRYITPVGGFSGIYT